MKCLWCGYIIPEHTVKLKTFLDGEIICLEVSCECPNCVEMYSAICQLRDFFEWQEALH